MYNIKHKKKRIVYTLVTFILCITASAGLIVYSGTNDYEENLFLAQSMADTYAADIESRIYEHVAKTEVLKSFTNIVDGDFTQEEFDGIAVSIYDNDNIRALQLLPKGVTLYSYPIEGNEEAIGNDLFEMENRKEDAIYARDSGEVVVSGPYELTQGGLGLIARNPIYLDGDFWGFSAIVLKLPDVLNTLEFNQLVIHGYDYYIHRTMEDGTEQTIATSLDYIPKNTVCSTVELSNSDWILEIVPTKGFVNINSLLITAVICLVVSSLITGLVGNFIRAENATIEAKQANFAKSDFLSRMSHDIRTPLNTIIGMTSIALDETQEKQTEHYLDQISSSGVYLLGLINDILDMNKIEGGKVELHPEPYSQDEFLDLMRSTIGQQCKEKNIDFIIDGVKESKVVIADKVRFNQIFLNLLNNAVKFTPEGGTVTYRVKMRNIHKDKIDYIFVISDTGCGMSEEFQEHMYDAFVQEGNNRTNAVRGSGLGLAITKSLVELMGGTIECDSKLGIGTTFHIYLTLPISKGNIIKPDERNNDDYNILFGKYILLAEDHPINAQICQMLLEKKGMRVRHAENGQEALAIFELSDEDTFDAILMDIRMPFMDGVEASKRIRSLTRRDAATIPIIAVTANAFDEDRRLTKEAGMDEHLSKPIDQKELFSLLLKVFGK